MYFDEEILKHIKLKVEILYKEKSITWLLIWLGIWRRYADMKRDFLLILIMVGCFTMIACTTAEETLSKTPSE